jgi:hypothetical protein
VEEEEDLDLRKRMTAAAATTTAPMAARVVVSIAKEGRILTDNDLLVTLRSEGIPFRHARTKAGDTWYHREGGLVS